MYDKLIFGKNNTENVVSIEIKDHEAEIFTETKDGVTSFKTGNKFWILSPYPVKTVNGWIKLQGDLHYKFGLLFDNERDFLNTKRGLHGDTYSIYDKKEAFMVAQGFTSFKNLSLKDVSVLSFDIETTTLDPNAPNAKILLISNTYRKGDFTEKRLFCYDDYDSVSEFIDDWCTWVREKNPSILCGHNIFGFDLHYLNTIAVINNTTLSLGRDNSPIRFNTFESKFRKDQTQNLSYKRCFVYGREIVDTYFLSIKYDTVAKKYESYGLKQIIKTEGLEKTNRVFYDASKIRDNYMIPEEWKKIKKYCEDDSDDSLALFDLMGPPFFYMTRNIPKSFQSVCYSASGAQINSIMVRAYLQDGHSIPKASMSENFEGAISFGNPGIYTNVFKADVASLYPSIMIQYEVYDKQKDPNAYFKQLVKTFTELRLEYKKQAKENKYYDDLQNAYKIFINSCFGFLGTNGLNFNSPDNASFITSTGRDILTTSIKWAEENGFKICNVDTDSLSICFMDGRDFNGEVHDILRRLNNLYPARIRFEDDGYYKKVIVFKAKNYVLWDGKKIKQKGSALKAGTKELALKEFMNKIVDSILNDRHDYTDIYNEYVKEISNITDIKRWSTRKTITDKVTNAERTNEQKVLDAIKGTEIKEGDRAYFFFKSDDTLCLIQNFNGDYSRTKLLEKLYKTAQIFETVLPVDDLFLNFKLKRNQELLKQIA
jgi:DNA polymerase elongation subunit (family B)